jgi:aryl-alcohol dehydrogenase-like predicted oxidoreductase
VFAERKDELMADLASTNAASAGTINIADDLRVNRLGFGAMRITGRGIWGEPPDREEAKAVLRRAIELGINFIDTADSYGPEVSETLIAEALQPYPDDLVLATKGGLERPGPNKWTANGTPEHLRAACERSLRRLGIERIPLYQLHAPASAVPYSESIGALVELQNEGKIDHIGISNVSEKNLREAQRLTPIASIQNRYNVGDRRSDDLVDLCEQEGIAFIPWAPIIDVEGPASAIAAKHQADPRQIALAWLLARSPAMLPIPGTSSVSHLENNVAAAALRLSPQELERLQG